ncbi:YopX family protein [Clostridium nigeriense]|uniref:YopX family protein n=1 Tax=Clostridium nigeriense TaxID=1805470 RepID=UPI003D3567DF
MREIKFRVWDSERKKILPIQRHSFKTGESMPYGWNVEYVFEDLMQYTGLKDKNGKEIYEGDIVKAYESNIVCEVIFSEGAMFMLRWNDKKWGNNEYHHYGVRAFTLEVIGNIYENPELLEGN